MTEIPPKIIEEPKTNIEPEPISPAKEAYGRFIKSEISLSELYTANANLSSLSETLRAGEIARELAFTTGEASIGDARQHFRDAVHMKEADQKPYLLFTGLLFLAQLPIDEHLLRTRRLPYKSLVAKAFKNTVDIGVSALSVTDQLNCLEDRKPSRKMRGFASRLAMLGLAQDHYLRNREAVPLPVISFFTESMDTPHNHASTISLFDEVNSELKVVKRVRVSTNPQAESVKPALPPNSNVIPIVVNEDMGVNERRTTSARAIIGELYERGHTRSPEVKQDLASKLAQRRQRFHQKVIATSQISE